MISCMYFICLSLLDTRKIRGDQLDIFCIDYENIDRNIFFTYVKEGRTKWLYAGLACNEVKVLRYNT